MMVMIQDNVPVCPICSGALRKIHTNTDIIYVCNDKDCGTVLNVLDVGQSQRELKCEVIRYDKDCKTGN